MPRALLSSIPATLQANSKAQGAAEETPTPQAERPHLLLFLLTIGLLLGCQRQWDAPIVIHAAVMDHFLKGSLHEVNVFPILRKKRKRIRRHRVLPPAQTAAPPLSLYQKPPKHTGPPGLHLDVPVQVKKNLRPPHCGWIRVPTVTTMGPNAQFMAVIFGSS